MPQPGGGEKNLARRYAGVGPSRGGVRERRTDGERVGFREGHLPIRRSSLQRALGGDNRRRRRRRSVERRARKSGLFVGSEKRGPDGTLGSARSRRRARRRGVLGGSLDSRQRVGISVVRREHGSVHRLRLREVFRGELVDERERRDVVPDAILRLVPQSARRVEVRGSSAPRRLAFVREHAHVVVGENEPGNARRRAALGPRAHSSSAARTSH
mmetsp:Transcript_7425/g.30913  ORF Transcript_7425/g.30913 Transcript_7425/m.30913 type:complete len:214 (-) Transcript_7425:681-1322(-)